MEGETKIQILPLPSLHLLMFLYLPWTPLGAVVGNSWSVDRTEIAD
jgi:hypothetical protein